MSKKLKYNVIGAGLECNQCGQVMERREHNEKPLRTWFYTEWDYCKNNDCNKNVQHYEKYKSSEWQEDERQESFFRDLR